MIENKKYPPSRVKRLGWVDAKTRIENIMHAGMVLQTARDEQFDKNFAGQPYRDSTGRICQSVVVSEDDLEGIPNYPYGDKIDVADALLFAEKQEQKKSAKRARKAQEALEKTSSKDFVKEQNTASSQPATNVVE